MKMMTMMVGFEPQTNDENGEIEIIIAKQRNGNQQAQVNYIL